MAFQEKTAQSVLCVICHQPIDLSKFGTGRFLLDKEFVACPNSHLVHRTCLQQWIPQSKKCPVCYDDYDLKVIELFEEYLRQMELDKQRHLDVQQEKADREREREESDKEFDAETHEILNKAEALLNNEKYGEAVNLLWDLHDQKKYPMKDTRNLYIILQIAVVYYNSGQYPLGLRQLNKIIKVDYEYPLVFYYMGMCYSGLEMSDKVKWAMDRAVLHTARLVEKDERYQPFLDEINSILDSLKKNQ